MHLHGWLSLALGCPAGRQCHQFCSRPQIVLLRLQGPLRGHLVSFCWVGQPAALLWLVHAQIVRWHFSLWLSVPMFLWTSSNISQGSIAFRSFTHPSSACCCPLVCWSRLECALIFGSMASPPWDPPCDSADRIIQKSLFAQQVTFSAVLAVKGKSLSLKRLKKKMRKFLNGGMCLS